MEPSPSTFDAIVFDVGGTLLHTPRDPQQVALERIAHLGRVSLEAFRAGVQQAVAAWRRQGGEPHREDHPDTWVQHYTSALAAAGFSGDCALAARLMEESFLIDGWEVYPDVIPILETLCTQRIPIGVVSNWPPTLEATLERAGLREYFSVVVTSGVVGYAKPHHRIFQLAAAGLGVDPARVLYVGDDYEHDVVGPKQVGMGALLLDRRNRYPSYSPRITDLTTFGASLTQ